jgi:hypothetical protein
MGGNMNKTILALILLSIAWSHGVSGLDFSRELNRQKRVVKVGYRAPPKSMAHFLRHYPECRKWWGDARSQCNLNVAKREYSLYQLNLKQKRTPQSQMVNGEFQVSLEKRKPDL